MRQSISYNKVIKKNKITLQPENIIKDLTSKANTQNKKQHDKI